MKDVRLEAGQSPAVSSETPRALVVYESMFGNTGAVVGTTMVTLILGHFHDQAEGLRYTFVGLGVVVLLSQICVFFVPDAAKNRRVEGDRSERELAVVD